MEYGKGSFSNVWIHMVSSRAIAGRAAFGQCYDRERETRPTFINRAFIREMNSRETACEWYLL